MHPLSHYRQIFAQNRWQPASEKPPAQVADWLLHPFSLTEKLQTHCTNLQVEISQQGWQAVNNLPIFAKNPPTITAWLREVLLSGDGQAWIFAQTLLPQQTVEAVAQAVLDLGEKPIGLWLFPQNPQRISLEWTQDRQTGLFARRSQLVLQGYPLWIYELFLPQFPFEPNGRKE